MCDEVVLCLRAARCRGVTMCEELMCRVECFISHNGQQRQASVHLAQLNISSRQ